MTSLVVFLFYKNLSKLFFLKLSYNQFFGTLNPNSSLFKLRHLRYLSLAYNNFGSSLPYEFGNLNKLEKLYLYSNDFFGQIPHTISNLTQLTVLYLYQNNLIGSFPLIQNLTKLSRIDLHDNHFTGTVSSSLFTMPFLSYLDMSGNDFTGSIEVPNSSTSSRLESLYLGQNHFDAEILGPISKLITIESLDLSYLNISTPIDFKLFSSLKSLLELDFSGNNISSTNLRSDLCIPVTLEILLLKRCGISKFPNMLKNLQKLELIDLSANKIKGRIPQWLWSLPRLTSVNFRDNLFNGFEGSSESLVNSYVRLLALDSNNFEGTFPHLPLTIIVVSASDNSFTGDIPLSICNRSSLATLLLSNNNFTGPIPQCLGNLTLLNLWKNNLEGCIPDAFYDSASLQVLNLGYNRLTGKLPRSLVHCSSLKFFDVRNNEIKDMFPLWLKALPNLKVLILSSNKFYGPISPPHHGPLGFPELRIFEISNNKFTRSLPPNYFVNWKASSLLMNDNGDIYMTYDGIEDVDSFNYTNSIDSRYRGLSMENKLILTSYAYIDLSGNLFEGQIPESIGLLKALVALSLSNNAFSGYIPRSLANLEELQSLDMSRNKLSGTIPQGLGSLSFLAFINVSHNQLKGEIPQKTQITGQSKSCFEGNVGLCGLPLEESCFEDNAPPTQHHKQEEEEEEDEEQVLNGKAMVIGYGGGVLFGLAIAQLVAFS